MNLTDRLLALAFVSIAVGVSTARATDFPQPPFDLPTVSHAAGYLDVDGVDAKRGFCNAILIGENIALTNHHCIDTQATCDRTRMLFTSDGETPVATFRCTKLIETGVDEAGIDPNTKEEDRYPPSKDVTLFELEGSPGIERGFLPLSKMTAEDGAKPDNYWLIQHEPPVPGIRLHTQLNYSICHGALEADGNWLFDAVANGEPCHTVPGISGSALINAAGELVGLVSMIGGIDPKASFPPLNDFRIKWVKGPSIVSIREALPSLQDK